MFMARIDLSSERLCNSLKLGIERNTLAQRNKQTHGGPTSRDLCSYIPTYNASRHLAECL